ncbi:hypothetical protein Tcan_11415 [Toxocara canis]|uniref:Large ribosomal subunit protein bL12 oligomerization domain-containing protein n=1 Tax=Toxocara canis TaxID=6265 RepID=A0A0B2VMH2_TOXCA|nr:hypothetical protein Tcan_11415 [Toxocara canis]
MTVGASRVLSRLFTRTTLHRLIRNAPHSLSRCFAAATTASSAQASPDGGLPLEKGDKMEEPSDSRLPSEKVQRLVDEIVGLSLLDVADLNKALKKRLNLPDVPAMMAAPVFAGATAPAPGWQILFYDGFMFLAHRRSEVAYC